MPAATQGAAAATACGRGRMAPDGGAAEHEGQADEEELAGPVAGLPGGGREPQGEGAEEADRGEREEQREGLLAVAAPDLAQTEGQSDREQERPPASLPPARRAGVAPTTVLSALKEAAWRRFAPDRVHDRLDGIAEHRGEVADGGAGDDTSQAIARPAAAIANRPRVRRYASSAARTSTASERAARMAASA